MSKDFQRPEKMAQEFLKETLATANKTCTVILWDHLRVNVSKNQRNRGHGQKNRFRSYFASLKA